MQRDGDALPPPMPEPEEPDVAEAIGAATASPPMQIPRVCTSLILTGF